MTDLERAAQPLADLFARAIHVCNDEGDFCERHRLDNEAEKWFDMRDMIIEIRDRVLPSSPPPAGEAEQNTPEPGKGKPGEIAGTPSLSASSQEQVASPAGACPFVPPLPEEPEWLTRWRTYAKDGELPLACAYIDALHEHYRRELRTQFLDAVDKCARLQGELAEAKGKHIDGKWCADLHCAKCYTSARWMEQKLEDTNEALVAADRTLAERDKELAAARVNEARWKAFCMLWAASTILECVQDEDGSWCLRQIDPAENTTFAPLRGDDPDAAIDAARKGEGNG